MKKILILTILFLTITSCGDESEEVRETETIQQSVDENRDIFDARMNTEVEELIKAEEENTEKQYPKSLANYEDFKNLVGEVESYRKERLIDLDTFLKMSKEKNTVILDTRSTYRYERKHIQGAIHLSFTDFTQSALNEIIPDTNTRILIYCNNNFRGEPVDFASKVYIPNEFNENQKPVMLALNIPTYLNLYGYGYKNVYELDELVNIDDTRIKFGGTENR